MSFELPGRAERHGSDLAIRFKELLTERGPRVFKELERTLEEHGFALASAEDVALLFSENSLLCRNENFTRVMDLLIDGTPIAVRNREYQANMCIVAGGEGFRVAMSEGFSGEDVGGVVRTVVTFRGRHLSSRDTIPHDAELWALKPKTAQVSIAARGEIPLDDIEMVSFRFPTEYFPEELLTDDERERLNEAGIRFIVRHYIPERKTATH
ncbi:MAG TPA: hypothetical protein VFS75_01485 [Candidatus Paceibacterota bacterium]|nr:hypothetical protein [Candidatus Paceibacterota bacterium]